MNELTRAELIDRICLADATCDCGQGNCSSSCDKCEDILNYLLDRYDAKVRADERKKAERDFQNSDYWNDYLEKVIADARADERAEMLMPYDVESIDDLIENVRAKVLDEFANWYRSKGYSAYDIGLLIREYTKEQK